MKLRQLALLGTAASCLMLAAGCGGNKEAKTSEDALLDEAKMEDAAKAPEATKAAATATENNDGTIDPNNWPMQKPPLKRDPAIEARVVEILSKMTVEEKVGQIIQGDIGSLTPEDVRKYNLGSVLNGGNSAPNGDNRIEAQAWIDLADEFWEASTDTSDGGLGIPALWGTDAVHGHNNIVGATVFPHNIGLGAANNPDLMEEIGRITAKEILVTGLDWTFAPTIAVVRNDRWGRTYESYSEDPAIVAAFAPRLVKGIQGAVNTDQFLNNKEHLISTVKHFVGDGGTIDGKDQGNNISSEADLRDIQAAGYPPAIMEGVQVVMASFNGYHGRKMHGHKELLSDVLVGRMGFDGFVVGDWNGHGQVKGCTNVSCAASFNAGLDMFMAPDSWKGLYENTLAQVKSGEITMERLDEAVTRILRVKLRSGLFEAGKPSSRTLTGQFEILGSPEHTAVARQAVRESLVLLKNNDSVLPLKQNSKILVAGDGADNIGKQSGGWTLTWQGTGNKKSDFPNGTSIFDGIKEVAGENATLSVDGSYTDKPDVAVVVFGEEPYAEFQGDTQTVDFESTDGLALLEKFKAEGIPTVAIFLSGRPMWVNPELNASDAFVAAWLPGAAGNGVADVLMAKADGSVNNDFKGRLSFSWPKSSFDTELNVGDENYDPLFAFGYGLTYAAPQKVAMLPVSDDLAASSDTAKSVFMLAGKNASPWRMVLRDAGGETQVTDGAAVSTEKALSVRAVDDGAQENTSMFTWEGPGVMRIAGNPVDIARESNAEMAIQFRYKVIGDVPSSVVVQVGDPYAENNGGSIDFAEGFKAKAGQGWQVSDLRLSCFETAGADMTNVTMPFSIAADAPFQIQMEYINIVANEGQASCNL